MCPDVCLICGKTIQSDDQKSATFFFLPLCAWTLQPPELSQHFATDTGRTCYPYYNRSIVHIFESLYCPSCHVSHTSVQHLWGYLLDRKLAQSWTASIHKRGKLYLHFHFYVLLLSVITWLQQTPSDPSLHEDNWQTTEMPDERNAITQIKACLGKKMSKSAVMPFIIFRLGSRDFLLFIKLYSWVTDRQTTAH